MDGPEDFLVTKASATRCRIWEDKPQHICPLPRTHSNMTRFAQHDEEYDKVLQRLKRLVRRAISRGVSWLSELKVPASIYAVPKQTSHTHVQRLKLAGEIEQKLLIRHDGPVVPHAVALYG